MVLFIPHLYTQQHPQQKFPRSFCLPVHFGSLHLPEVPTSFCHTWGNLYYRCQNSPIQCHLAAQWPRSPISTPLFLLWDCSVCMCEARCEGRCFLTSKHKTWNMSHCPPFQTLYAPPLKLSFQKYHWGMGVNHGCVRIKGKCKDKICLQSFSLKGQPPVDFILFIFLFLFLLNLFLCS